MSTTPTLPEGAVRCPRCDTVLGPEQDWCLVCGAPARTRLAPRPNWKAPVVLVSILLVASVLALVIAFVSLTGDDNPPAGTTTAPAATAPAAAPPPVATTPPATAVPPATSIPATTPSETGASPSG